MSLIGSIKYDNKLLNVINDNRDKLYEEYRHIVDTIRNLNYPNSFKYLLLNETLK